MENRKQIEVIKQVVIEGSGNHPFIITKDGLQKTLDNISDTDKITCVKEISEWRDAPMGYMGDDNQVWVHYWVLVVKNYRPETDDEYFKRNQNEQTHQNQIAEKEKLEYLRLKAKFENQ